MTEAESFIIGSPDFPQADQMLRPTLPGMFNADDTRVGREKRGIPPDAQTRFDLILKEKGWERLTEIAPGLPYPSLDEWVAFRINYVRGTRAYPCFITDASGDISFLKVSLRENSADLYENEAKMLEICQGLIQAPRLMACDPARVDSLPYLQMAAIAFEEGRVGNADEWSTKHVKHAVQQIRALENIDLNQLPDFPNLRRSVGIKTTMLNLLERAGENLPQSLISRIRDLGRGEEIKAVLVHGDLTIKNIILNREGTTTFVDWELGGRGFLGQDAGKLLTNLLGNQPASQTLIKEYLAMDSGGIDQERLQGLVIGVVAENLVHFVWRIEKILALGKEEQFPKVREEMTQSLRRMEEALTILTIK